MTIQDTWRLIHRGLGHTTRISQSVITVEDFETIDAGYYICTAQNLRGQTTVATTVEFSWLGKWSTVNRWKAICIYNVGVLFFFFLKSFVGGQYQRPTAACGSDRHPKQTEVIRLLKEVLTFLEEKCILITFNHVSHFYAKKTCQQLCVIISIKWARFYKKDITCLLSPLACAYWRAWQQSLWYPLVFNRLQATTRDPSA